ncbi:hypothetical protein VST7929_02764 [Vibrio stylophorae]|uniref:Sulphur transport domain-containing protein n=1 Tax=Vibrio stylophorae TaxID=659351 RepID=A0ABM8ZWS7_9VIBR|nr:YeeE/YedE thiosulfate transporter family protein [Vibrio stylophorae]CAH0535103.1 hypothetical protein VST7929_02764 [Vibrio stylophorae]
MLNSMIQGLAGGVLLGLSAALLMLALGKTAGISGIVRGALGAISWRWFFLAGLLIAGGIAHYALGVEVQYPSVPLWYALLAGGLVGVGTRLANGCTSGHGIIGLSRLSLRSMVATVTFMGVAIVVVTIRFHGGW